MDQFYEPPKKKKKTKLLAIILSCTALIIALFTVLMFIPDEWLDEEETLSEESEQDSKSAESGDNNGKYVVCIYLCGSDLESQNGAATDDLNEMLEAKLTENVKVVIETGGAASWMNETISPDVHTRLEINNEGMSVLEEVDNANMGDQNTFTSFLDFCKDNYDADNRMLILWNHGGGSAGGVAYDEQYDYDSLSVNELQNALDKVYPDKGREFDVIGFDACLMANVETADAIKEHSKYMVASEETEPGNGWEYTGFLNALTSEPMKGGSDIGKSICDSYIAGCKAVDTDKQTTLSVIDLDKINQVVESIDLIGTEILEQAKSDIGICGDFTRCAASAENYGGNNEEQGYANMVDIGHLVEVAQDMLPESKDVVLQALNNAVVYQVQGKYRKHAHGISVYFSYNNDADEIQKYEDVGVSTPYTKYLQYSQGVDINDEQDDSGLYSNLLPLTGFGESDVDNNPYECGVDDEGYISLTVNPEVIDTIASIKFKMFYLDEENNELLYLGADNDITSDWDNGVFKDNFRGVWGTINDNLCCMELFYEGDDYNLYAVPARINGEDRNIIVAYDYETDAFDIVGMCTELEDNGMAQKDLKTLNAGDEIVILMNAIGLEEDSEMFTYEYEPFIFDENTQFLEEELYNGTYGYMFSMEDVLGESIESDVMFINYNDGDIQVEE